MLPSIDTQQRRVLAHNWVLVGVGPNLNQSSLVVLDEPCPSTALNACERGIELGLEGGEIAVRGFDCGLRVQNKKTIISAKPIHHRNRSSPSPQTTEYSPTYLHLAAWLSTTTVFARCQVLPEQAVVDMATAVEVDQWLQGSSGLNILLVQRGGQLFGCGIVAVDVCLVVVLVVQFHDLSRDGGFERAVIVLETQHSKS
jgi:hypothetical protein